jgi:glutathionylspermidine synthase
MIPSFSTACTAMDELEERVYVSEDSLEGLRRCMFSHMESPIFAMELLLAMPYLPQRHGSKSMVMDEERMDEKFRGMLSERVILRVLEDVMVDECEREGEDDLLSDLNIEAEQEEELLLVVDTSTTSSGACSIGKRRRKGTHRQLR